MKYLEQTMRWHGPADAVSLSDIRQAGATGVVSALHEVETGLPWPKDLINVRKSQIEKAGMTWSVVESVNIHESIKIASSERDQYIDWYRQTLENLAQIGIHTVCYNFMPATDWCRTDLVYEMPDGSRASRFERLALIAFDLFILKRPQANNDYSIEDCDRAAHYYEHMTPAQRMTLQTNVTMGLPGNNRGFSLEEVRDRLAKYDDIKEGDLRNNLKYFIGNIIEVAEKHEIKMTIHPDDPPFALMGLSRIMSTEADALDLVESVPSPANGLCFCTGSFGVRADNDLPGMAKRLAKYIHFIHLRNIRREADGNFFEADHLDGETDMFEVMSALTEEQQKREHSIPMRPDHGHAMLDDLHKVTNPGYTAIGRLRGLAELRGLEYGILRSRARFQ
jgi:mannonate dehydratase